MANLLDDKYLEPYAETIRARSASAFARAFAIAGRRKTIGDVAVEHEKYGLHYHAAHGKTKAEWVFREWAPNATAMWLVGDFNRWQRTPKFKAKRLNDHGDWECRINGNSIRHGDKYHLVIKWPDGEGERIPAYAQYVTQDEHTKLFSACVWKPARKFRWKNRKAALPDETPLIYEAHIGMATEEPKVGSYTEFRDNMLPRIKAAGYNVVQLMAVMEHPYYGSFGYHVSSFFAASSRFGTPDELKSLVDTAHGMGLRVIMDLVHSHAVANERDGLSKFDGTDYQYFHSGAKGWHGAWGSRCFDYGKDEVIRFLLSNCRFWLEEYDFDGYRFDGITSMLFWNHGLGTAFCNYGMYFDGSVDVDAWNYLQMANRVIHEMKPKAITIAEDVSGMPGVAARVNDCGIGFDYRMAMGEPDFWFKLAEDVRDEDWPIGGIFWELTNRRAEEKVVSYVESHDQALVGGKTFFFDLVDKEIYWGMRNDQDNLVIERGIALHKMARLATCSLNGGAYLNFMGNEFGHPEWIDFPREGNGWSYHHARRQWSLGSDRNLRFKALADFDATMLATLKDGTAIFGGQAMNAIPVITCCNESDKVLAFVRGNLLFVFNFHPNTSYDGYGVMVPPASDWKHAFDSDEPRFGGQGRIHPGGTYAPSLVMQADELVQQIKLYLPARTATVLKRVS